MSCVLRGISRPVLAPPVVATGHSARRSEPEWECRHMATTWQPTTLVQCVSLSPWLTYPGCDEPGGCHDLTLGRIYELVAVEADGAFYRIVDDSDDDFLYPASHFRMI
jgi:hypothetical protein